MPSYKSRFTIADRARDDDHAAVVWEGVGELLWHPLFICSQRAAAGAGVADVGERLRAIS